MFSEHNAEVEKVWRTRYRIPMVISANARMVLLNKNFNENISFKDYYSSPLTMLYMQCKFKEYLRHYVYADHEMGMPVNGWDVNVDFQNDTECGWLGAEVKFSDNNVPFTIPFLNDDNKNMFFEKGIPDTFGGLMGKIREYYDFFCDQKQKGYTYKNLPLNAIGMPGLGTDGPMTLACMLRGTENFCIDLYEDTGYALKLLDFLTEASIKRIKSLRKFFGAPEITHSMGFADDSISLLSCDDYRDLILPYHKKLLNSLSDNTEKNSIHLCGDASRHFKLIKDELNVNSYDTGFPINFTSVINELGPDVTISGGVHVNLLHGGTKEDVINKTKEILNEVKYKTKNFIIKEANNLSPNTPHENIKAMYDTVLSEGIF